MTGKQVAFVMPAISFEEDYEPTSALGRQAEPNPFDDVVKALALTWNPETKRSARAANMVIPEGETRMRVTAKFGRAANAQGYTARFDDKASENGLAVVAGYLVPQITRTRNGSETLTIRRVEDAA